MNTRITDGSRVTLRCRVTDAAAEVLDDGSKPLVFVCGKQQVIAGLEDKLSGKERGFRGHIELSPEEAYGPNTVSLVHEYACRPAW